MNMTDIFKNSIDAKEIRQTIEAILKKHEKELIYFTTFNNKYFMLELEDKYLIKLVRELEDVFESEMVAINGKTTVAIFELKNSTIKYQ